MLKSAGKPVETQSPVQSLTALHGAFPVYVNPISDFSMSTAVQTQEQGRQPKRVRLLAGEREADETVNSVLLCNEYLRMGRKRSLKSLAQSLIEQAAAQGKQMSLNGTVKRLEALSSRYSWVKRAEQYEAGQEIARNRSKAQIMSSGMAQTHERVNLLNELVHAVAGALGEKSLYGKRLKMIGFGEAAQTVTEEFFRADEIKAIRGLLKDLAEETGGRIQTHNVNLQGLAGFLSSAAAFHGDGVEEAQVMERTEAEETGQDLP